jgi:Lon protease-like protein
MKRELPARPSLEHLKAQAKDLLEALREELRSGVAQSETSAQQRFRQGLPAARGASTEQLGQLALHDAQSVIAREYGFASWAELKSTVEQKSAPPAALPPEQLRALLERVANTPPPAEVLEALQRASSAPVPAVALPAELPLVPLRDTVLTVGAVAPIRIGRAASAAALDAAESGQRLLALFGQKNALDEAPGEAALHPVGCVAVMHERLPAEQGSWLVVRALQWVRLLQLRSDGPYLRARVERFQVSEHISAETPQLEQRLRERVRAFLATLPDPGPLRQLTERMSALELADATVANSRCSVAAKAEYAAQPELDARLRQAVSLLEQGG